MAPQMRGAILMSGAAVELTKRRQARPAHEAATSPSATAMTAAAPAETAAQ
jgi:hypothetical protein